MPKKLCVCCRWALPGSWYTPPGSVQQQPRRGVGHQAETRCQQRSVVQQPWTEQETGVWGQEKKRKKWIHTASCSTSEQHVRGRQMEEAEAEEGESARSRAWELLQIRWTNSVEKFSFLSSIVIFLKFTVPVQATTLEAWRCWRDSLVPTENLLHRTDGNTENLWLQRAQAPAVVSGQSHRVSLLYIHSSVCLKKKKQLKILASHR